MFTNTPILSLVLNIGDLSPNSLSQLPWHSGAAPIGQYFCNRRWLAAAAATLLTRFYWESRKGGNKVDIDYRFVVGEIEYLPLLWMPVSSAYTSALHKEMADVVMDLSNICRPEYIHMSERVFEQHGMSRECLSHDDYLGLLRRKTGTLTPWGWYHWDLW